MMKVNKWTLGLAAVGLVTIPTVIQAEEKPLSSLQTLVSSTTISGYVDTSAQWTIGKSAGKPSATPAFAFNGANKQDGFNLNAVNVMLQKLPDEKENWAAGYTIDLVYGPNAIGWNPSVGGTLTSDFAIKQAYVELVAPVGTGLHAKMGTFDSVVGYESFHSYKNPNYTRSYGFTSEPTEHTGLLLQYAVVKEVVLSAGVANTANAGINNRSFIASGGKKSETDKTYMAAITLTAPDSMGFLAGSQLYGGMVSGFNTSIKGTGLQDSELWVYGGAFIKTPIKELTAGVSYDYTSTAGSPSANAATTKGWFDSIAGYVSYAASEKLKLHARAEYTWMQSAAANTFATTYGAGIADKVFAVTGTVEYDLWANVISRLEVRWDHAANGARPYFEKDRNALLLAANVIYKF